MLDLRYGISTTGLLIKPKLNIPQVFEFDNMFGFMARKGNPGRIVGRYNIR
jgi:hypothetical protein